MSEECKISERYKWSRSKTLLLHKNVSDDRLETLGQARMLVVSWRAIEGDKDLLDLRDLLTERCGVTFRLELEELFGLFPHFAIMFVLSSLLLLDRVA